MCGALERHRLAWLFLERRTDLFDGESKRMLHVAPQRALAARLARVPGLDYVTADLRGTELAARLDITALPFADGAFDAIYCSHVLEHVPDDRAALREFHRVLSPTGWALLAVPITTERTVEDPSITDPDERERAFGRRDHVRRYGPDYVDRLRAAGFAVRVFGPADVVEERGVRLGIPPDGPAGEIYYCTRDG